MRLKQQTVMSRSALRSMAVQLYARAPLRARVLQPLRIAICPFEQLLAWVPETGRVVDVGCGAGLLLGLIGALRPGVSGIGIDTNGTQIAAAESMADNNFRDGRIRFERRSILDPWSEETFDVVCMVDVLHHIRRPDQSAALDRAFARVKPGGLFIYKDMAERPAFSAWWNRLHDLVLAKQWIQYRAIAQVATWLREADAEIIASWRTVIGPYAHEIIIAERSR